MDDFEKLYRKYFQYVYFYILQEGDTISELTDEIREDMNNILAGGIE